MSRQQAEEWAAEDASAACRAACAATAAATDAAAGAAIADTRMQARMLSWRSEALTCHNCGLSEGKPAAQDGRWMIQHRWGPGGQDVINPYCSPECFCAAGNVIG